MPLVRYQGRSRRRFRPLRWLLLFLVIAIAGYFLISWRVGSLLRAGEVSLLEEHLDQAAETFEAAGFYRLRPGPVLEARAVLHLARSQNDTAAEMFGQAREAGVKRTALHLDLLGEHFSNTASYAAVEILAAHRDQTSGDSVPPLWRGEAALAAGDLQAAEDWLQQAASLSEAESARKDRLLETLRTRRRTGTAYGVFDRRGRPVYGHRLENGEPVLETAELGGALGGRGGLLERMGPQALKGRVDLTLDMVYQKAGHAALGRYTGAFVALDPDSGEILALVNHSGEGEVGSPYLQQFEPGSIVKMLTLSAALDTEMELESFFPLNCTGNMTVDGKLFYDWTVHGSVPDIYTATAVSCNLAFAVIGLELGQARLDDALHRFGFNLTPEEKDLGLEMGLLHDVDPDVPRLGLAQRAVGLDNVSITPVHAALLAAAFAGDGTAMRPYLVASLSSLGSETPYLAAAAEPFFQGTTAATAAVVRQAMLEVVRSDSGTGRRASVPGLTFAIKTGTAGDREPGYNSIIFGFAPLENPVVAFGLIGEHTGKAELEGARIIRDFLITVKSEFGAE